MNRKLTVIPEEVALLRKHSLLFTLLLKKFINPRWHPCHHSLHSWRQRRGRFLTANDQALNILVQNPLGIKIFPSSPLKSVLIACCSCFSGADALEFDGYGFMMRDMCADTSVVELRGCVDFNDTPKQYDSSFFLFIYLFFCVV